MEVQKPRASPSTDYGHNGPSAQGRRCQRNDGGPGLPPDEARRPAAPTKLWVPAEPATGSDAVAQSLRFGQALELLQRVVLDLADALAGDAERLADLFEGARLAAGEPEAQLDHRTLALGKRRERRLDVGAAQRERRSLVGSLGVLVLDEVAELGVLLLADRLLERDGMLRHAQDLAHLVSRHLELLRDLLRLRLAAEALDELALDVHDLVQLLDHVHRDADRARLVRDRPGDRLSDPPGRIGGELVALAVVELLDRADEPE